VADGIAVGLANVVAAALGDVVVKRIGANWTGHFFLKKKVVNLNLVWERKIKMIFKFAI